MRKNTISWIRSSAGKLNFTYVCLILTSAVQSALMVFFALAVKELINSAVYATAELAEIIKNAVITLLFVIGAFFFMWLDKILMEKCRISAEVNIKSKAFKTYIKKDYLVASSFKSGDVLNRIINDSQIVAKGYATIIPTLVSMITKIVLAVGVLLYFQPIFTAILSALGIVLALLSFLFRKTFKKLHKRTRQAESDVMSYMGETTSNLLAVKVFSSENKFSSKADEVVSRYGNVAKKQRYIGSTLTTLVGFVFMLFYIFTVVWGAVGMYYGVNGIDFGMITAMIQLVNQLQSPFANITALLNVYYEMLASAERIIDLESIKDEEILPAIDLESYYSDLTKISFENVSFSYGREKVLENVSLNIEKGECVLIKGISGIGKSTLMKLLLGVFHNYTGEIKLIGKEKSEGLNTSHRMLFGYVPQGNLLFSGSIRENVCFLNENATNSEVENACKIAEMQFVNDLPQGLDTIIGEKGLGLSEGQAQRVAIARAVLSKRPILLLDEATSALDEDTEKKVLSNLSNLNSGSQTIVFVSHKAQASEICNSQITIIDGVAKKQLIAL